MQPVNMDSLQLQAATFYTFLYFCILLNTKRKAVNFTPVTFTGHLINGG